MSFVNNNSLRYKPGMSAHTREEEQFRVFLATVLTVDYERKVLTLEDIRTNVIHREVGIIPANADGYETTDIQMPEEGSTCLAVPLFYEGGYMQVAILNYTLSQSNRAQDVVATKALETVPIYNQRKRGNYRKAYPGQKSVSLASGYTEKVDIGWDKSSQDFTRDKVDPHRRTWTQITGRRVSYTDAGLTFQGAVNRPDADGVTPVTLPDGSKEYIVYLKPGAQPKDRYVDGKQDVIPFAENTSRIQEYALDYPLPLEVLQTDLLDAVLGTYADPWQRTTVQQKGGVSYDNETYLIDQTWDHPTSGQPLGPTTAEGVTPQRRAFIIEKTEGTLVGYNRFDKSTYGKVLKPVYTPMTKQGRFGADFETGYLPVQDSDDHTEARLAASAFAVRFPYEYNTTRWDVTKEGLVQFEIGSTLPKENIPLSGSYEHPHGAGRSMEGHLVGSLKLVVGKNRDEEDAIDLQALGQSVLRLGADDTSLPNRGRSVLAQNRGKGDTVQARDLQYWKSPKLKPGDAGDLENKTGGENVSLRMAADGALIARIGARDPNAKRRHLVNGYQDGPGKQQWSVSDTARQDSHTPGRPTYGAGDNMYAFHDLSTAGTPLVGFPPYNDWLGDPVPGGMDKHGLSVDLHLVRDALFRIGKNPQSGQSLLLDLDGGIVMAVGKDKQGRSLTGAFDGGVEFTIGQNTKKRALRLEINGDVDLSVKGNMHEHVTGDRIMEATTFRIIAKTDFILTAQKIIEAGLTRHTTEAPDIVHNQGAYESDENS